MTHKTTRKYLGHTTELPPHPPVVAIQKCDNLAFAFRNTGIKGRGLSAILFTQQPHARLEFLHDFRCAIRRTVIDDNDFALGLRKVLLQHTNHRLLDEALVVVRVNENADKTSRQSTAP